MLSEINLLPQKDQRSIWFAIVLTIVLAIGLIGGGLLYYQYLTLAKQRDAKQAESAKIAEQIEIETQKLQEASAKSDIERYLSMIHAVKQWPVQTANILDELTAALPASGFFNTFAYQDTGAILLSAQFNGLDDTAQYLHQLTYEDWVQSVTIHSIAREEEGNAALYRADFNIQLKRDRFLRMKGDGTG